MMRRYLAAAVLITIVAVAAAPAEEDRIIGTWVQESSEWRIRFDADGYFLLFHQGASYSSSGLWIYTDRLRLLFVETAVTRVIAIRWESEFTVSATIERIHDLGSWTRVAPFTEEMEHIERH